MHGARLLAACRPKVRPVAIDLAWLGGAIGFCLASSYNAPLRDSAEPRLSFALSLSLSLSLSSSQDQHHPAWTRALSRARALSLSLAGAAQGRARTHVTGLPAQPARSHRQGVHHHLLLIPITFLFSPSYNPLSFEYSLIS
jgi:hypothetical protein